ncbi:MAG: RagB/SusD family nutrient uptake outer membrane protein [Dysgonamonadaceae bacterium]|jgi:hypothetical protein|nr:RagB/SusD family nutrient uptake outer membrane protein [Dysgonamonadaceae bacterium]
MKRYIFLVAVLLSVAGAGFQSCVNIEVEPINRVKDTEIFGSETGLFTYRSQMYCELPIEDFKYAHDKLFNDHNCTKSINSLAGESISRDVSGAATEAVGYWNDAYTLIRRANYIIEHLPEYESIHGQDRIKHLVGEAYFIRAYTYYALAKRYGGVPIVQRVLQYPEESIEELQLPRSSEEATWDAIAADFDLAIANMDATSLRGTANKYVAAAYKSRAMLHAGSIAKYNTITLRDNFNTLVCGIPSTRANDYFKQSYDAAKLLDGKYSLYLKSWKSDDKEAQYKNFLELFSQNKSADHPEIIFVKDFSEPESVSSWDAYHVPLQGKGPSGYSQETNPTLDFIELFDGIEKDASGKFANLDASGNYRYFDDTMEPFLNVEPRLRATVILPGDVWKNMIIEIRRGIYTGSISGGISRFLAENATTAYTSTQVYKDNKLVLSADANQKPYEVSPGVLMNPAGLTGTFNSGTTCLTGFSLRKLLDESIPTELVRERYCTTSWVDMRYAEVLLNRAEAAAELASAGEGNAYRADAYNCIREIRQRAGAYPLSGEADLTLDVVRNERKKELAFEHKAWWDLRRWRTIEKEQNARVYRVAMPFYVKENGKYIFDVRLDEKNKKYTFNTKWYYQEIPSSEISKNPNIIQNPGY